MTTDPALAVIVWGFLLAIIIETLRWLRPAKIRDAWGDSNA